MWWSSVGPIALSASGALAFWVVLRRRQPPLDVRARVLTAIAASVPAAVFAARMLLDPLSLFVNFPSDLWELLSESRFLLPLVLGLVATAILGVPSRPRHLPSTAHLTPRTWRSFVSRGWLVMTVATTALITVLSLAGGFASEPDDQGRYRTYNVVLGPSTSVGTNIYGWHYSVAPLIVVALLLIVTWGALAMIARPPLDGDAEVDTAARRLRSANVSRIAVGAMLLHLRMILISFASTSALTGTFHVDRGEYFRAWTPFSALTGVLEISAAATGIIGLGLWIYTALTALPSARRRERPSERSSRPS